MAEEQRSSANDEPRRKGGMTGGGAAIADEGDMPFGIMAAIGVVIGIIVALGAGGSFSGGDVTAAPVKTEAAVEEDAEESAPTTEAPTTTAAPTTEAPQAEPADATVTVSADGIVLSGTVPDQATADALYAQALESFPADAITDELQVVDGAEPASLTLIGEAADGPTFEALSGGFGELGGEATSFTDELGQAEPQGAAAVVTATQAGITLTGTVPDQGHRR